MKTKTKMTMRVLTKPLKNPLNVSLWKLKSICLYYSAKITIFFVNFISLCFVLFYFSFDQPSKQLCQSLNQRPKCCWVFVVHAMSAIWNKDNCARLERFTFVAQLLLCKAGLAQHVFGRQLATIRFANNENHRHIRSHDFLETRNNQLFLGFSNLSNQPEQLRKGWKRKEKSNKITKSKNTHTQTKYN